MEYYVSLKDKFSVCLTSPLTNYDQKLFVDFYQPLLSHAACSLFQTLHAIVPLGTIESSDLEHKTILKTLKMNTIDSFLNARFELEALGLLDVYVYNDSANDQNLYVYVVKKLPTPWEFFHDEVLSTFLLNTIGEESYHNLACEYLAHRYDLGDFTKITKNVDDVFNIDRNGENLSNWWVDSSYNEINTKNPHFDYEYYLVLVGSRSVVNKNILDSVELYKTINRLAWLFGLTTEELANATIDSTTNGIVDLELLRTNVKKIYSNQEQVKFEVNFKQEQTSNNKFVKTLNSITPSQLVENKYNTKLTGSEIETFDKLLVETNISVGILNVLIIYVMDTKNGEIPSYNYFLKIINTWIRKGVKTTEDALNLITTPNTKNKTKNVPTWYQDYLQNEVDSKKEKSTNNKQETLDDLEEFFNKKE